MKNQRTMPIMKNENIGEWEPAIAIDGHRWEKFRRETKSLSGIFQHSLDIPLRLKNYDELDQVYCAWLKKRAFMPLYIVLGQQRACMPVYIGKSGDLVRCYRCLTDTQTTEYRATQLLSSIQFKLSHAIYFFKSTFFGTLPAQWW